MAHSFVSNGAIFIELLTVYSASTWNMSQWHVTKHLAEVPLYPLHGYGFCWGYGPPTRTPTLAKPVNLPWGFLYLCQSLLKTSRVSSPSCYCFYYQHSRYLFSSLQLVIKLLSHHGLSGGITSDCAACALCNPVVNHKWSKLKEEEKKTYIYEKRMKKCAQRLKTCHVSRPSCCWFCCKCSRCFFSSL
jgi:hypothetical protein